MRFFVVAILLLFFGSCTNNGTVPRKIIPPEKMENILWDMAQADQFTNMYLRKDTSVHDLKSASTGLYDKVFAIHKISKEEFQESFKFYTSRPDLSKIMFDSLFARGNRYRAEQYRHPIQQPFNNKQPFNNNHPAQRPGPHPASPLRARQQVPGKPI